MNFVNLKSTTQLGQSPTVWRIQPKVTKQGNCVGLFFNLLSMKTHPSMFVEVDFLIRRSGKVEKMDTS